MTPAVARTILTLKLPATDLRRMNKLLQANKNGVLTPDQAVALEDYRTVGRLLDLMRLQARRILGET